MPRHNGGGRLPTVDELRLPPGEGLKLPAMLELSAWTVVASEHDGVPVPGDVGLRSLSVELRIPRDDAHGDNAREAVAELLTQLLPGARYGGCAGAPKGAPRGLNNSWLLRLSLRVESDGQVTATVVDL